jgi:hypothetical protein
VLLLYYFQAYVNLIISICIQMQGLLGGKASDGKGGEGQASKRALGNTV